MIELISQNKSFGGWHKRYRHPSTSTNCDMTFAVYLPPQAEEGNKLPVLYWLSGLTCTDENFMQKSSVQRIAAELGLVVVAPDTSPRGEHVANDEGYDLGQGAGFYVNATQQPWQAHYQMYDYIVKELPDIIEANFPVSEKRAISGHSMGGHGALTIALRNPERYTSVSAFSPICAPMQCPWGQKAFSAYLGDADETWREHDAVELLKKSQMQLPMLIEQGSDDEFLQQQLKPELLLAAAESVGYPITYNQHDGYDHSYYFIASFIDAHCRFHAKYL